MKIKGRLSYRDYRKYFLFYARMRYTINFLLFFIAFTMVNVSISAGRTILKQSGFVYDAVLALVVALIVTFVMLLLFLFQVKANYNKNERIRIENEYIVSDEGITIKSERGDYLLKWSDLTKAFAFQGIIVIYSEGNQATILPESYFSSGQDWDDFKAVLRKNIKKTKL